MVMEFKESIHLYILQYPIRSDDSFGSGVMLGHDDSRGYVTPTRNITQHYGKNGIGLAGKTARELGKDVFGYELMNAGQLQYYGANYFPDALKVEIEDITESDSVEIVGEFFTDHIFVLELPMKDIENGEPDYDFSHVTLPNYKLYVTDTPKGSLAEDIKYQFNDENLDG